MDNSEGQKKLTFVLQLLEDLRHLNSSSIHKCYCEICEKKSSLICSSITKAIEVVGQVFRSLSLQSYNNSLPEIYETKFMTSYFDNENPKPSDFQHDDGRCGLLSNMKEDHVDDGAHLKVPNAESSSQSMLSSTKRDSGVHCENLLQSHHSISPIRVSDEAEGNKDRGISPNCSSTPTTTKPLSNPGMSGHPNTKTTKTNIAVLSKSELQDEENVVSVAELLSNMRVALTAPLQDRTLQQSDPPITTPKAAELETITTTTSNVPVISTVGKTDNDEHDGQRCQFQLSQDSSIVGVNKNDVLLSDARLPSSEVDQSKAGGESFLSVSDSRLSDSFMWRPWEVKDDIYRIISDSSIGEDDDDNDDTEEIKKEEQENVDEICFDFEAETENEKNDESHEGLSKEKMIGKGSSKNESLLLDYGGQDLLSSPCKKSKKIKNAKGRECGGTSAQHDILPHPFKRQSTVSGSDDESELDSFDVGLAEEYNINNRFSSTRQKQMPGSSRCCDDADSDSKPSQNNIAAAIDSSSPAALSFTKKTESGEKLTVSVTCSLSGTEEEECASDSNRSGSSNSRPGKEAKCRQTLFSSCPDASEEDDNKENHPAASSESESLVAGLDRVDDDVSTLRQPKSKKDLEILSLKKKDVGSHLLSDEKEEIVSNVKANLTISRLDDDVIKPPEIIISNVDNLMSEKKNVLKSVENRMDKERCVVLCRTLEVEESMNKNKSTTLKVLGSAHKTTDSHSFCNVPHDNNGGGDEGSSDHTLLNSSLLSSKKSRIGMKTFPPKHKTKRVFVKSTQQQQQQQQSMTSHNKAGPSPSPRKFPVMGIKGAIDNKPSVSKTFLTTNEENSTLLVATRNTTTDIASLAPHCSEENKSNIMNENKQSFKNYLLHVDGDDQNQQGDCFHTKLNYANTNKDDSDSDIDAASNNDDVDVDFNQKGVSSSQLAWGAPAATVSSVPSHSHLKQNKGIRGEQNDSSECKIPLADTDVEGTGRNATTTTTAMTVDHQLLREKFGKLSLTHDSKDSSASLMNKSLPVSKSSEGNHGLNDPNGSSHHDNLESLDDFDANQSFPRMADSSQRKKDCMLGAAGELLSSVASRSVGIQNLALDDDIHRDAGTPSTLTTRDTGLTPRNRRSIFGFSPPNAKFASSEVVGCAHLQSGDGTGIVLASTECGGESAAKPPQAQSAGHGHGQSPPSPILLDKLWSAFDASDVFPRRLQLEEVLFNCVSSCICVVDTALQGKIVSVNEAFQQLVGIHEKILGQRLSRFIKVRSPPADMAVSTPQLIMLADGSLAPVSGKLVSCITARGEEMRVSMWSMPVASPCPTTPTPSSRLSTPTIDGSSSSDHPGLTVCVIGLVLPMPDGYFLSKSGGHIIFEDGYTAQDVDEFHSLTRCKGTIQTGLVVAGSDGHVEAWDDVFFDLFVGRCNFERRHHISRYLSDVVKILDSDDEGRGTPFNAQRETLVQQSPAVATTQSSPSPRSHILSRYGGDVCFLKESAACFRDDKDREVPGLLLPVDCFLAQDEEGSCKSNDDNSNDVDGEDDDDDGHDDDFDDGEDDVVDDDDDGDDDATSSEGIRKREREEDGRRLRWMRQEKSSFIEMTKAAESLKQQTSPNTTTTTTSDVGRRREKALPIPSTSTPCKLGADSDRLETIFNTSNSSTPCQDEEIVSSLKMVSDDAAIISSRLEDDDNDDDGDDDDGDSYSGECVEISTGIYSAKFHSQFGDILDVTFKLGTVQTGEKGTFFCFWFSMVDEAETTVDHAESVHSDGVVVHSTTSLDGAGNHHHDDDYEEEERDSNDDGDSSFSFRHCDTRQTGGASGEKMDEEATSSVGVGIGPPGQKRLNQLRNINGGGGTEQGPKKADVSLGQFITDQAGLNQSLNATVGEDVLDLEQAVLGSFSDAYRILETLGQGSFGFVRRAFPLSHEGNSVVVKFIKKSLMLEDGTQHSLQGQQTSESSLPTEVAILQTLDHNNIVKLLDVHENDQFVQLVMEDFASLDLFDFIDQVAVDELLACHIFKQIAEAVDYLHSKSILHRDIKDENVIISTSFHCKLIDFGSAAHFLPPGQLFDKFRGTMEYCSPEVHLNHCYVGPELDAWALGVTLYTIVYRENPYTADVVPHQMEAHHLPHPVSHDLMEVMFGLLCCDPDQRFSVAKALSCCWVKQDIDLSLYDWDQLFTSADDYVEY